MQLFKFEVQDSTGKMVSATSHALPAIIGRGATAGVRLTGDDPEISRVHAEIVADGAGGFQVIDRSRNGTAVGGRTLSNGQAAPLDDGAEIGIGPFTIRIALAKVSPPALFVTAHKGRGSHAHSFPLGETMLAIIEAGDSASADLMQAEEPEAFVVRSREAGKRPLSVLSAPSGKGSIFVAAPDARRPVLLNRSALDRGSHPLRSLDVVKIGSLRLEVVAPGEKALVCVNADCELLNPYKPDQNCRWCGYKLVEGATRIVG